MTGRPFAVFDIDGTLIRWQLFHAIVDELGRQGHVSPRSYEAIRAARMQWKRRHGQASYREYEHKLVEAYDQAVAGLATETLLAAVSSVFDEYKDQVYTYTRDLIRDLKDKKYLLFAISGSHQEIVKLLAHYYGFDDCVGSKYQQQAGKFTGQREIMHGERKIAALEAMIEEHGASRESSLAIGDSEGDIAMLEFTARAIAFNPTEALFEHAKSKGWPVVIERKNMVYKLEAKDGSYILA